MVCGVVRRVAPGALYLLVGLVVSSAAVTWVRKSVWHLKHLEVNVAAGFQL